MKSEEQIMKRFKRMLGTYAKRGILISLYGDGVVRTLAWVLDIKRKDLNAMIRKKGDK